MANTIIGREQELKLLDKIMASEKAEFLVVYGRRRVGKTFLIDEHLRANIVFSFSGAFERPTKVQLANFFREYIRSTKGQQETSPPKNWDTAFSYLTDYLYALQAQSTIYLESAFF